MKVLKVLPLATLVLIVSACAQLPKDYEAEHTTAFTDTTVTALGLRSISARQANPDQIRVIPLLDGVDAFYARTVMTKLAERSLDIQYFLWHKDVTGQVLLKFVLDAADRGVRVRMLLDDLDNQALDAELYALDTHANISIRLFNPFATRGFKYVDFFTDTARLNRRMHNKSFTADNQYTVVGGRNVGDEYFDALADNNFYDLDLLVTGPLVQEVSNQFDIYWNHEIAVPIYAFDQNTATAEDLEKVRVSLTEFLKAQSDTLYADDVRESELADALQGGEYRVYTGNGKVIFDDPDKGLGRSLHEIEVMQELLDPYFKNAKRDVILISPYFVPGDQGVKNMIARVDEGVSVSVITNSYESTDSSPVHAAYSRYREALLAGGVKLYELKRSSRRPRAKHSVAFDSEASLHTKTFIVDGESVFVGSLNLDPRSIDINTEMGILLHSPEMARTFSHELESDAKEHIYELKLVRNPPQSKGEFTTYTYDIVWLERVDGEIVRHESEPGIGFTDQIKLFFSGLVPESQI